MSRTDLSLIGRIATLVAEAGAGLRYRLRLVAGPSADEVATLHARIEDLALAISRLASRTEELDYSLRACVTREDLAEAMERAFGAFEERLESSVDERLMVQSQSVAALRQMLDETDDHLGRLLEAIESARVDSSLSDTPSYGASTYEAAGYQSSPYPTNRPM